MLNSFKISAFSLSLLMIAFISTVAHSQTKVTKATISCPVTESTGNVRWARAEIQFPDGFEFYGPARKTVQGSLSLQYSSGSELGTSIQHLTLVGSHIRGEHFNSPDYWLLIGKNNEGHIIRFNLEQNRQSQGFAFGEVYLENGQKLNLQCNVNLEFPPKTGTQKPHCHPRAPC